MAKKARLEIRIDEETKELLQEVATKLTDTGTVTELLTDYISRVILEHKTK